MIRSIQPKIESHGKDHLGVSMAATGHFQQDGLQQVQRHPDLAGSGRFVLPQTPECHLVSRNDPLSLGAEQFQTLASRLKYCQSRRGIKKLLITSAVPGEGKTLIAANLAVVLAQHGNRVLVIDGDLRHPGLGSLLDLRRVAGLGDWWVARESIEKYIYREESLPLWILPAGVAQEWPLRIVQSGDLLKAIASLTANFDWIIIDSPPLMPFADASAWDALSDACVLVTRQGVTPTKLLQQAIKSLDSTKIVATILNEAAITHQGYYHYYYDQAAKKASVVPTHERSPLLDMKKK